MRRTRRHAPSMTRSRTARASFSIARWWDERAARFRIAVPGLRLADHGTLVPASGLAHRVGHLGNLLFKPAVGRTASGTGGSLCGIRDLGSLAFAPAAHG